MGNIFCSETDERKKQTVFEDVNRETQPAHVVDNEIIENAPFSSLPKRDDVHQANEVVVQATARAMVAIKSTRGSTGYYDQGFAAALAEHLEHEHFPDQVELRLPPISDDVAKSTLYARLSQVDGDDPFNSMDRIAEQFLDAAIPKKERLFANAEPVLENLM